MANKESYDEEEKRMATTSNSKGVIQPKITRSQIEREKELETLRLKEAKSEMLLQQKKLNVPDEELPENINRLDISENSASGVDQALKLLSIEPETQVLIMKF